MCIIKARNNLPVKAEIKKLHICKITGLCLYIFKEIQTCKLWMREIPASKNWPVKVQIQ